MECKVERRSGGEGVSLFRATFFDAHGRKTRELYAKAYLSKYDEREVPQNLNWLPSQPGFSWDIVLLKEALERCFLGGLTRDELNSKRRVEEAKVIEEAFKAAGEDSD